MPEWWHIDKIDFNRSKSYVKEATIQEHTSEQRTVWSVPLCVCLSWAWVLEVWKPPSTLP